MTMSRSKKRQSREARENLRSNAFTVQSHARRAAGEVDRALWFMQRRAWRDAQDVLEASEREFPCSKDVLHLLMDVYLQQGNSSGLLRVCKRLVELEPGNQALHLTLAGAYLQNGLPAAALRAFRSFVERWPCGRLADDAREEISQLEPMVERVLVETPFPPEFRLELAELHEEVLSSNAAGDYVRTIAL